MTGYRREQERMSGGGACSECSIAEEGYFFDAE
jgi:hypothetical protein